MSALDPNANALWARALVEELSRAGVRHAVVSPGSRSAPLALACAREPALELHVVLDERAAGFFALGLARGSGAPALLVCTSGTAVANYLPAVLEAHLAHVPLVVLSADRAHEQRDCGAGQALDQIGLYGSAVRWFQELSAPRVDAQALAHLRSAAGRAVASARATPAGPVHLNQPLREPLSPRPHAGEQAQMRSLPEAVRRGRVPGPWLRDASGEERLHPDPARLEPIARALRAEPRGWIAAGSLPPEPGLAHAIGTLARALGWPILADVLSGLREAPETAALCVGAHDALLRSEAFLKVHAPRACLRFGGPLTSKAFGNWLEAHPEIALTVVDPLAHREPTHGARERVRADPRVFAHALTGRLGAPPPAPAYAQTWLRAGARAHAAIHAALEREPTLSEAGIAAAIGACIPRGARVFAGNSMPVRDLDSYWPRGERDLRFAANRGANGIDGTLSSALGWAAADPAPLVALVGDLALLHDWHAVVLALRERRAPVAIAVVDNRGGGIFERLPIARQISRERFEQLFATPQPVALEPALRGFGAAVRTLRTRRELEDALRKRLGEPGVEFLHLPVSREESAERQRDLLALAERAALETEGAP